MHACDTCLLTSLTPAAAARTLRNLAAGSQLTKDAIIAAGAVPWLVALLKSDWSDMAAAAEALQNLAAGCQHNRDDIIAACAAPLLVGLLRSHQPRVQTAAAEALRNFAAGSQLERDVIIAAGAVEFR